MRTVLAVDPGRDKCGLAIVTEAGTFFRAVVPTAEIGLTCRYLLAQHPEAELVVGDGTGAETVVGELKALAPETPLERVPERDTTRRARQRYLQVERVSWWQRLLPVGMRVPPRPVDDYAAVILAEDYLVGK